MVGAALWFLSVLLVREREKNQGLLARKKKVPVLRKNQQIIFVAFIL